MARSGGPPPATSRLREPTPSTSTFADNLRLPVHGWFRYPAGFSAAWVQSEIARRRPPVGSLRVFDPFVGSGTTLVAAQQVGADALGTDSHAFVARVANAKLCWTANPARLGERAEEVVRAARPHPDPAPPTLLARCYTPTVLAQLRGLRRAIDGVARGDEVDQLLWLALVAILRPCSHVGTAQWQYVLPSRSKARVAEPIDAFRSFTTRMRTEMAAAQATPGPIGSARCLAADARGCAGVPDRWADLVITSPPYANNFDYADATRLELTFLGDVRSWSDLSEVRRGLLRSCSQATAGVDADALLSDRRLAPIGAELDAVYRELARERCHHGGRKAYHLMVIAYFRDQAAVWESLRRVTAADGEVCFVVGDSAPYGVHVPVERWLGELAVASGFSSWRFEKLRDRNVKWLNRKHRVPLQEGRLWVT